MRLSWHGDTLIDPPTTFEEAVRIYKSLKNLTEESRKVVMFSLAPITDYCKEKDTILNAISTANVASVSFILPNKYVLKKWFTLMQLYHSRPHFWL